MLRLTNKRREEASVKRALTLENEIELIEGCRAGKDSARKELYTLYSKQMLAVCSRYTGDVDAAHDVLHDGFIKIFTHFTFRGECALSTWVTRVMVTQAIDYLRKQQRFSQLVVNEEQLPDIPDEAGIAETGGRISEEMLMAFVAELPDGCRTVFNLYVFEEKSHKEIAEILHIKEHSSTSQLHRAKCLLIKRIKELYIKYKEIINYLIFGVLTTLVNLITKYILLFTILDPTNGFQLQIAIIISWIVAVIFAYFTNRKFVFESKNQNKLKEFISFVVARIATLLLEMFIMWFFVTLLKLDSDLYVVIFTLVAQVAVIIGNYIFSKLFVFKKTDK